jgi:predicted metalloprotease with PDZ domain
MRIGTRGILAASLAAAALLVGGMYVQAERAKQVDRPYLGIAAEATNDADKPGVTVLGVRPEGPAGKAGLKKGDRIVAAGTKEVKTFKDLAGVLAQHKPGDALAVKAVREGKEQAFNVTLAAAPAHHAFTLPGANGKQEWRGPTGEDMESFLGQFRPFLQDREKTASLEKKVEELEKRIGELEKKVGK